MTPPDLKRCYVVFAQRVDARVDVEGWNAHATRFFATRIGLTMEKRYALEEPAPLVDEVTFIVAPNGGAPGIRSAFARPCSGDDHALADAIDATAGGTGLALLARRCTTVWLVVREADVDPLALRLAAILASVLLGPILDCAGAQLFGVKTARAKLDAMPT